MLDKMRAMFSGKKSVSVLYGLGAPQGAIGMDLFSQALNGYDSNAWVMACIDLKCKTMAGIDLNLYSKQGKRLHEIEDHPLLDLIREPIPGERTWADYVSDITGYKELNGNSFSWANHGVGNRKEPYELHSFRPDRMRPLTTGSGTILTGWQYYIAGMSYTYTPEQIMHTKYWNPTHDILGLSRISSVRESVLTINEAKLWNRRLLENGARPMGAFKSVNPLSDAQFTRLQEQFENKYAGPSNAGKPVLLEGGMDWVEMGLSPADMAWLESVKASAREICMIFQTPPELLGDATNKTYSNYQEARQAYYKENILPSLDQLLAKLNAYLTPFYGKNLFLKYDRDDIEAIQEDRTQVYSRLGNADWLTINEKRAECGYEAIDGGDVLLIPMGKVPVGPDAEPPADALAPEPEQDEQDQGEDGQDQGKPDQEDQGKAKKGKKAGKR